MNSKNSRKTCKVFVIIATSASIAGCNGIFPHIDDAITPSEAQAFSHALGVDAVSPSLINNLTWRKEFASMKMYEQDKEYESYWHEIEASDTFISFGGDIAQLGLTTAATAIPVTQATKVLSAAATAVGASKTSYKQEFLIQQTKEALKLRADQSVLSVQKTILARLNCDPKYYPFGMLLQDLHSREVAGTFEAALASISKSASTSQGTANSSSGKAAPVTTSPTTTTDSSSAAGATKNSGTPVDIGVGTVTVSFKPNSSCPLGGK